MGKPLASAKGEALAGAEVLEYYAGLALDLHGDVYTQQVPDAIGMILHEPVGVVAAITPWNFPLALLTWKLGPAFAAGCTVVCKPSHLTSGVALELARLFLEAGLPPGALQVVTGEEQNGAIVGQALVDHPGVDKVAFTGSTATGKKIAEAAARSLKRISLETMKGLRDLSPLATAPALEELVVGDTLQVQPEDFTAVAKLPTLKRASVFLGSNRRNEAVKQLLGLPPVELYSWRAQIAG
jgi:delta 1-pyrroline-5-carboxylate dehydrogenase